MKIQVLISNYLKFQEFVRSASPHTLRAYSLDLTQALGPYKNNTIAPDGAELLELCRQAQSLWAELAPASRNRKAGTLKSFLGYLFNENLIQTDLALRLYSPSVPRKIPHFISVDEAVACLKSYNSEDNPQERILFLLLYGAGLRVSEACNLQNSQFEPEQRRLRIMGKGKKDRLVILPQNVSTELQRLRGKQIYIWGDTPLNTRRAYEWIRQRGLKAGLLRPLHPHALRHSFATHLLTSGAQLRVLQELLGHESLAATEKYTHLGVDQLARTMEMYHPLGEKNLKTGL